MHVMQNKKQPSTTPECADTSKKRKETVNRIKVAGQRHLENQRQHTLRAQAFFVLIAHGRLYSQPSRKSLYFRLTIVPVA